MSCPEAARLILSSREPVCFGEWQQEEPAENEDFTKDKVFTELLEARDVLFGILQNRDLSIADRAVLYLMYASQIQYVMDNEEINKLSDITVKFSEEAYINKCLASVRQNDAADVKDFLEVLFDFLGGLENINQKWILLLEQTAGRIKEQTAEQIDKAGKEFAAYYREEEYVYEHLMVYYVYRYFMKMVFDGDLYAKSVMCIVTLICIREMDITHWSEAGCFYLEDQIQINYLYSKEIEHCEENLARLYEEFWDNPLYQPKNLIENLTKIL